MIRPYLYLAVLLPLVVFSQAAAQTCQSETARPSSTPTIQFTNNNDGTVTDKTTGLMWARCPEGQSGENCSTVIQGSVAVYDWEGALNQAQGSTLAGYSDWRLPNIKELSSIVEERCFDPAINLTVFPSTVSSSTPSSYFWSASPYSRSARSAWSVQFINGGTQSSFGDRDYGRRVRLVRSGQ